MKKKDSDLERKLGYIALAPIVAIVATALWGAILYSLDAYDVWVWPAPIFSLIGTALYPWVIHPENNRK